MTTLGDVQLRLNKLPCGTNSDRVVLLGIINDAYREYIDAYQWSRLAKRSILQTTAVYREGFVTATNGSAAITGTSTIWTSAMTGRRIRIGGRNETYIFTFATATTATLDRAYEGDDVTDSAYYIFQSIYALASDCDVVESISVPGNNTDLDRESEEFLDKLATDRWTLGRPAFYTLAPDVTVNSVPTPAVELYPVPEFAEGLVVRYMQSVSDLSATSDPFLPWVEIGAIIARCEAKLYAVRGDLPMFQIKQAEYKMLLDQATATDSDRQYPDEMFMDERYTWHRTLRALGHDRFSRHWWQLRNSN